MYTPKPIAILKSIGFWILFIVFLFVVTKLLNPIFPVIYERFVYGIGGTIAAFALCWLFIKGEKKTFRDYELNWQSNTIWRFIKGFIIGAAIFGLITLALMLAGGLRFSLVNDWDPSTAFWFLSIIPLALMEEIVFRSYPFLELNKAFGLPFTQAIVAIAFAGYHIAMGWDITVALLGPGIWALVFGLGAAWSKGIALPTGIHVALNLSQQVVGMKSGKAGPIWVFSENADAALLPADTVGIICQVVVGVLALIITILYSRKK